MHDSQSSGCDLQALAIFWSMNRQNDFSLITRLLRIDIWSACLLAGSLFSRERRPENPWHQIAAYRRRCCPPRFADRA